MTTIDMTEKLPTAAWLLDDVSRETGLFDFGDASDPGFRDRVARMIENAREQNPSPDASNRLVGVLRWLLTSRLQLFADRDRYAVAEERVSAPVMVLGEPRAGTTLLHALLAEDPQGRAPRFWEIFYPSPPPALSDSSDPRIERANEDWRQLLDQIPKWLISHPYNDELGLGLPECERFWAMDFRAATPSAYWRVPLLGLGAGLEQDFERQYEIHRMTLQQLQFGGAKSASSAEPHWVLKGTSHHVRLKALLDTYPDAHILWIHRDPVVTTASFQELIAQVFEGIAGEVDRTALAASNLAGVRERLSTVMSDPLTDDPRIVHVPYHEVFADPVEAIRRAYDRFGREFSDRYRAGLDVWLGNSRRDRYGRFSYSMEALGVDLRELYDEFQSYFDRFGVRPERRP
jgi:Sulfotransferase family